MTQFNNRSEAYDAVDELLTALSLAGNESFYVTVCRWEESKQNVQMDRVTWNFPLDKMTLAAELIIEDIAKEKVNLSLLPASELPEAKL